MFWQNLESDAECSVLLATTVVSRHEPVMVKEVLEALACGPGKNFLDLTLGGGGHAEAILSATAPDGKVLGSDRDQDALRRATERLASYGERLKTFHGSFKEIKKILAVSGTLKIDGALIDCGVSSHQLDEAGRGFSFLRSGPLDMRMDATQSLTAKEWLTSTSEEEIANTIYELGDERHSRRIAQAIVRARRKRSLNTTLDLAEVVRMAVPSGARFGKIHPATRTFQAIRIVVNDEMGQLSRCVSELLSTLSRSARIAVITFHSLEDRIVKNLFREAAASGTVHLVYRKPLVPSDAEIHTNPRARSAKLRAVDITRGNA